MMTMDDLRRIEDMVTKIRPILAKNDPGVVGAVLAELLAMLCAGILTQDPDFHDQILQEHLRLVKELIPGEQAALLERLSPEMRRKAEEHLDIPPRPGYLHS